MNQRLPLAVAVITLNEAENLPRCLASVRDLAAEIVVIDSGSTDDTRAVAERAGAVFEFHPWAGHIAQKNVALRRCAQPWVLAIDADEAVSPELAAALRELFARGEPEAAGYFVSRRNFYLGEWIWHAWYPEWRLRLVRRTGAQWGGLDPHDKLEVTGNTRRLSGDLLHYSYTSLQEHFQTELKYARIMAESYARTGKPGRWYQLVFSPWLALLKVLVLKSGWRDGWRGWVIAGARWMGTFAKYAFLLERQGTKPEDSRRP
jgi:glycosyltransferase involved in cell wall biosynthesis